jgi:prophage maintenance system killer protein
MTRSRRLRRTGPQLASPPGPPTGEAAVFIAPDGRLQLDVQLDAETVWLSLMQMVALFERDKSVISRHLRKAFASGELERAATVAKNATVELEGGRQVVRQVDFYNLDAILSVGYRVNSRRGTQFRIWATRTLREHLIRGFTINERRLAERGLGEMQRAVGLLARTLTGQALVSDEGRAVLDVVHRYTRSWRWFLEYDDGALAEAPSRPSAPHAALSLDDAHQIIATLRESPAAREESSSLFGQEQGDRLAGVVGAIEQTFDRKPLYPSAQARAAHLLYFLIKDHPFVDGNKRIGSLLFLEYLRRNDLLLLADGRPRLEDNAIVALALLVAESDRTQKDLMLRLILNLLEDERPGPAAP